MFRSHRLQDMQYSSAGGAQAGDPKPAKRYKDPDRLLVELLQNSNIEHQLAKESEKKVNRKWIRLGIPQSIRLWCGAVVCILECVYFYAVTCFKPWLPNQQQTTTNYNQTSGCHQNRKEEAPGPEILTPDCQITGTDNIDYFAIQDNELAIVRYADNLIYFVKLYSSNYPAFKTEILQTARNVVTPASTGETVTYGHNIHPKDHRPKVLQKAIDKLKRWKYKQIMSRVHHDALSQWVLQVAFLSRLLIFALQAFAFNGLQMLKHDNDGFKFTPEETYGKLLDGVVNATFGGYVNWDAHYFLHISVYGYTEENFLAFFPLLPLLLYVPSRILYFFMGYLISLSSLVIILGFLLNTWLFVKTAGNIYQISRFQQSASNQLITTASVLFAFNPASIFFNGLYTETLFAYLTSSVYLSLLNREKWMAVLYTGLSCLCRSNGILNIGFLIALDLADEVSTWSNGIITFLIQTCFKIVCSGLAFCSFQAYCILRFCGGTYDLPYHIPPYCVQNKQSILPSTLPYSHIQKKYWNVGFLQYFQWKQIPNFALALPVLYVLGSHAWKLIKYVITRMLYELKLVELWNAANAAHALFLTLFCFFCMHVQVSTRMIMAACPYLYVSMATRHQEDVERFRKGEIQIPLFAMGMTSWCMFYYFFGTILFSLGLPWT